MTCMSVRPDGESGVGDGGEGDRATMEEEFASIGVESVRRSDDSAPGNWRCDVCVLSAAVALQAGCEREEEFWRESGEVMQNLSPRWETSCDRRTDTTRRAAEVLRKWWAGGERLLVRARQSEGARVVREVKKMKAKEWRTVLPSNLLPRNLLLYYTVYYFFVIM